MIRIYSAQINTLLNTIDQDLRNERNRFVHDLWQIDHEAIVRRKHGARVVRPQSRVIEIQRTSDRAYVDVAEVAEFTDKVARALDNLLRLERELVELHEDIWSND